MCSSRRRKRRGGGVGGAVMVDQVMLPCSQIWLLVLIVASSSSLGNGVNQEGLALLSFKGSISEDPYGSLGNWNSSDPNPCSWNGVICRGNTVISLSIPRRRLVGSLSSSLGSLLPSLRHLNLRSNRLEGSIPHELFSSGSIQSLVLSGNSISGSLPSAIGNLSNLQILDISHNLFNGSLPFSLLKCSRLKVLDLSRNGFSFPLPYGMGNGLLALEKLNLSYNQFNGSIPGDIGNLSSLKDTVDFSHNLFSGSIPPGLGNLPEKVYIDLTYNNLSGPIPQNGALVNRGPTAFIGNPGLCGAPLMKPCSTSSQMFPHLPAGSSQPGVELGGFGERGGLSKAVVVAIIASDVVGMCLIALVFFYCYKKALALRGNGLGGSIEKTCCSKECLCFRKEEMQTPSDNADQLGLVPLDGRVNFDLDELLKASAFVLGKNGYGIVYRVVLEDGLNLVVRRLGEGGSQRFKEFRSEVEAIGKVRHPNIVSLRAYYWSVEEKLLVYDYIPNGDLSTVIHGKDESVEHAPLMWRRRLKIMIRLANGLTYLHEVSPKKYVHGDLKPCNILVGPDMEPYISDFGVGRLASLAGGSPMLQSDRMAPEKPPRSQPTDVAISPLVGTALCYQAPESFKTLKPSQRWDTYSYGVILLEMISGKQPIVQMGNAEITLVQWVKFCIEEKKAITDLLDPCLMEEPEREEEIIGVLKIALACVKTNPEKRPSMRHVLESLEKLTSTP